MSRKVTFLLRKCIKRHGKQTEKVWKTDRNDTRKSVSAFYDKQTIRKLVYAFTSIFLHLETVISFLS